MSILLPRIKKGVEASDSLDRRDCTQMGIGGGSGKAAGRWVVTIELKVRSRGRGGPASVVPTQASESVPPSTAYPHAAAHAHRAPSWPQGSAHGPWRRQGTPPHPPAGSTTTTACALHGREQEWRRVDRSIRQVHVASVTPTAQRGQASVSARVCAHAPVSWPPRSNALKRTLPMTSSSWPADAHGTQEGRSGGWGAGGWMSGATDT